MDRRVCLVCLPLLSSHVLDPGRYLNSVMACILVVGQKQFVLDPVSLAVFALSKHLPVFCSVLIHENRDDSSNGGYILGSEAMISLSQTRAPERGQLSI